MTNSSRKQKHLNRAVKALQEFGRPNREWQAAGLSDHAALEVDFDLAQRAI
jgi:hypothetical protein